MVWGPGVSSVHPKVTASTPFIEGEPASRVSREWFRLLMSIVQLLGNGREVTPTDEFQAEVETSRAPFGSTLSQTSMLERLDILESDVRGLFSSLRNGVEGRLYDVECLSLSRKSISINNELLILNAGTPVDGEIPQEAIDGLRVAFSLTDTPISGSVHLYLNGIRLRLTTDYSVSGKTITYTAGAKPALGDNHYVDYRK